MRASNCELPDGLKELAAGQSAFILESGTSLSSSIRGERFSSKDEVWKHRPVLLLLRLSRNVAAELAARHDRDRVAQ